MRISIYSDAPYPLVTTGKIHRSLTMIISRLTEQSVRLVKFKSQLFQNSINVEYN